MDTSATGPETINRLRFAADGAFAMLAGMQLDVFTPLKNGPMTADQIADAMGVNSRRLRLLLYSLVTAGLLTERNGKFSNTPEADQFFVKDAPTYIGNRHAAIASRWAASLKIADSIRSGKPQAKIDFSNSPQEELEKFLRAINPNTVTSARALLKNYDFSSIETFADVGSGGAGLAITIANACPHIAATAVDLPQMAPIAEKIVQEQGATDRVKVLAADVVSRPLPGVYDAAVLRALLQVFSPADARAAVKNVGAAIKPGGKVFIVGQILDNSRTAPLEAVGFNLSFISMLEDGESHTEAEYRDWLMEAGFVDIERAGSLLPEGNSVITARKS